MSYEDSDYFSIPEIPFLAAANGIPSPAQRLKSARDHRKFAREIKRGKRILTSHARILAKVNEYWKLTYNEKFVDWRPKTFAGKATEALWAATG